MSEAYHEGYSAYCRGLQITDNPYSSAHAAYSQWQDGWYDADWDAYNMVDD